MTCCSVLIALLSLAQGAQADNTDNILDKNACGPICLAAVAQHIGRSETFEEIFELLPPSGEPRTLENLKVVAGKLGLRTAAIRWRPGSTPSLTSPAVIRLNPELDSMIGHFIVLLQASDGRVQILDLPNRPIWVPLEQIWEAWDGVALHIANSEDRLPQPSILPLRFLGIAGVVLGLGAIGLLSIGRRARVEVADDHSTPRVASNRLVLSAVIPATAVSMILWFAVMQPAGQADAQPPLDFYPKFCFIRSDGKGATSAKPTATFRIRNNTQGVARISETETTCGCATPRLTSTTIPPKGEVELKVALQPSSTEGPRSFKIYVRFSHPEAEVLELPGIIETQ